MNKNGKYNYIIKESLSIKPDSIDNKNHIIKDYVLSNYNNNDKSNFIPLCKNYIHNISFLNIIY